MLLVDTSVWIDYIGANKTSAVMALDIALAKRSPVVLTEWIYLELLQGARSREAFSTLRSYLSGYPVLKPIRGLDTFAAAADLYRRCREQGITPRSTVDCLIACIAIEHQASLLHSDRDFEHIATVEPSLVLFRLSG